jgi:hypothetical protein
MGVCQGGEVYTHVERERECVYRYPLCWILFYCWNIINSLVTTADFQVIIVVRVITVKKQRIIVFRSPGRLIDPTGRLVAIRRSLIVPLVVLCICGTYICIYRLYSHI